MTAKKHSTITSDRLKEVLIYSPDTGMFVWRISTCNRVKAGDTAGCIDGKGYVVIKVDKNIYFAHRLAFLYMTGELPDKDVDHVNGVRSDNSWGNLRLATRSENSQNKAMLVNNTSGFTGVSFDAKDSAWVVSIQSYGIRRIIGRFKDKRLAIKEAITAKEEFHKFNPKHRWMSVG